MTQDRTGPGLQVFLAVIAAVATIAAALIGNWQSIFGPESAAATTAPNGEAMGATTLGSDTEQPATTAGLDEGECRITIANPLAVFREEPDVFAQEVGHVPAGVFGVLETRSVSFGSQDQRWFRISVEGRSGWIRDSSFDVASKTAACP